MKIEPEGVKILILPDPVPEKTDGGIYRPQTAREQEQHAVTIGTVVAIGPAAQIEFDDAPLEEGDRVVYAKYGGFAVKDEDTGIDYRILNDEDIIARIS